MAGDTCLTGKPEDRRIFQKLVHSLADGERPVGELAVAVGRFFLGRPYAAGTLEKRGPERLVVNLRQFDCFTLVENAAALARLIGADEKDFAGYLAALEAMRYRGGLLNGYASRLHYFSDWLRDNERKRILKDVTREIGGSPFPGEIGFMTRHSGMYPALRNQEVWRQMRIAERRCSRRRLFHIPKKELKELESGIRDGDLIGVTTDTEGLDVVHAGLAVRVKKKLHLLHASRTAGMVLLSPETLSRYLAANKTRAGVIVGRLKEL
jgi:hypothetical protein